jgi:UDP-3-O-[3-hydroxymyristoyl] glucosamine N-acyltransferase
LFLEIYFLMEMTIEQLAKHIGAVLAGDNADFNRLINGIGPIITAGENEVTFVSDRKHKAALSSSNAGAVIVSERIENFKKPQLIVKNVNAALIETLNIFTPKLKSPAVGIDSTAKLGEDVKIAEGVSVGANVVIDDGVEIGENTVIGNGCRIGQNSKIGKSCRLDSNVVIYHNCLIGNNVIIQANSTIGSTGFGYSYIDNAHRLIPHNGGVIIEDFVEIGANSCVDRAKFGNTIIGAGTKIDNLVQIAHNVVIGKCCLIAALVGISGSCKLGDGVILAGQVGLVDNIEVGNGTMVGAQAGVINDVPAGQKLAWTPALEWNEAMRIMALTRRLPSMAGQLKEINKRLEELEAAKDHKT